jgi:tetratricopeptide (TPR) repeat protein
VESSDRFIKDILDKGPSPGTIYLVLSRMKEEGHLQGVIEECLKALVKYPDDINIRRLLGESYLEDGRLTEAELEFKEVISHIENSISCYSFLAELLIQQKREEEALKSLKLYLAHCPDDKEALDLLESLQPVEDNSNETSPIIEEETILPEAPEEEVIEEPVKEGSPDMATAALAEEYCDQGLIDMAVKTYEKLIVQDPDNSKYLPRLNEIMAMKEDQQKEIERVDRAKLKKEKMIAVLESWLESFREQSNTGETAN